jgi:DNA-directed RNA polymerase subunit RPC12/RpoP
MLTPRRACGLVHSSWGVVALCSGVLAARLFLSLAHYRKKNMITTCSCNQCSGKIEFDILQAGERIQCPHCSQETLLFMPTFKPKEYPKEIFEKKPRTGKSLVEEQLDGAGVILLCLGILGFLLGLASLTSDSQSNYAALGCIGLFQGIIFYLLFKGFAEVIRLLRK